MKEKEEDFVHNEALTFDQTPIKIEELNATLKKIRRERQDQREREIEREQERESEKIVLKKRLKKYKKSF